MADAIDSARHDIALRQRIQARSGIAFGGGFFDVLDQIVLDAR